MRWSVAATAALALTSLAVHGCSDDTSTNGPGTGAWTPTAGSGGVAGSGGIGGVAGAAGQGGLTGAGGTLGGAGGAPGGSGGTAGSGGATGGAAGSGGSGGSAGSGGLLGGAGGAPGGSGGTAGSGGATGGAAGSGATAGSGGTGGSGGSGGSGGQGGDEATVTDGAEDRILLLGTVITPTASFDGQVLVEGDTITCAEAGTVCEGQPGATGATVVDTHGIISPGLIDTHNHILYDIFDEDDWMPHIPASCTTVQDCIDGSSYCTTSKCDCVDSVCRYLNHNNWTSEDEYALMSDYKQCLEDASQGKPLWCPQTYDGAGSLKCEMDKWGELKGMIAGTTSIVGLPGTSSACFGSLSRSIDVAQNDLGYDHIQTSALFPPSASSANAVCENFADGDTLAYLIHCGEGANAAAQNEFTTLGSMTTPDDCLYSWQTAITHGTAYTSTEFGVMGTHDMKLTWSPASNIALYGVTTNIPAALAEGLTISIAPDWSMGGSQNMLDEMRFGDAWDDAHFGDVLDAQDLVEMATVNAAHILALDGVIGSIVVGAKADLFVVGGDPAAPYEAILAATPREVRLVMVGGVVLYGDDQIVAAAPAVPGCESMDICGRQKFLCVAEDSTSDKLDQTYAEIESALQAALLDLDGLTPLDPELDCTPDCDPDEECYARTDRAQVDPSLCPDPGCCDDAGCDPLEACYQLTTSTVGCLSVNACAPMRTESFAPLAPVVKCQ